MGRVFLAFVLPIGRRGDISEPLARALLLLLLPAVELWNECVLNVAALCAVLLFTYSVPL